MKWQRGLLVCILLVMGLLSGCWDRNEVNQMAIVVGAAVDKKSEDEIELTVQIVIPQSMAMGQQGMSGEQGDQGIKNTLIVSAGGNTIYDAAVKIQEQLPRRLFWGHIRALVISEAVAKEPFTHHVDFFLRHPQPRLRTKLFVCEGNAKDILNVLTPLEKSSAEAAQELSKMGFGLHVTVMDFLQMVHSEAHAAALPWLEISSPDQDNGDMQPEYLHLNGSAIIQNGQMAGKIDDLSTRGLLWIMDKINLAEITFTPSNGKGNLAVQIIRSKTRLIPEIHNGKWRMTVRVDTFDDIVENHTDLDLDDPRVITALEKDLEKEITQLIRQTVQKVQKELKTDCLGFADAFYRKFPAQWRQAKEKWETMFPEIKVDIQVTAKIKRYGLATHSQGIPKAEESKK